MAFKQPRVPEYRESEGTGKYIRSLVLFLKDFCMDVWTANNQRTGEISEVRKGYPVTSVCGKTGEVTLTAGDVGALAVGGTAADSSKLDGKTLSQLMLAIYPVGAVYVSVESTSPASLFGGTWEQIKGRFLLGTGAPENNDDGTSPGDYVETPGSKSGEAEHALTESEMPEHDHNLIKIGWGGNTSATIRNEGAYLVYDPDSEEPLRSDYFGKAGGNQPHNNMPPYLAVYMWKRVS